MILTGVEIYSEPPFQMRDASDGFMKRLPEWLREELKPIDQRKDCIIMNSVHRFWIEAGQITYEHQYDENNNIITYYLSDMPMCVKKQLMQYDEQGNLIDDLSKVEDGHSSEGDFAQAFTRYYDQMGSYFPELLRLKELLKRGVLLVFIRSTLQISLKEGTVQQNNRQGTAIDASNIMSNTNQRQQGTTTGTRSGGMSDGSGNRGGFVSSSGSGSQVPSDNGSSERQPRTYQPTGRAESSNLNEQIAMQAAQAGAAQGKVLKRIVLRDPKWPAEDGWVKMRYYHESTKIVIHYVFNNNTGEALDFKFK
ncbi:unnamed protein product [Rotaria sp. Silwood1]|nr:unnamed protein product [Rotaria sp. Silwood1]